jgi:hypothetical protein
VNGLLEAAALIIVTDWEQLRALNLDRLKRDCVSGRGSA